MMMDLKYGPGTGGAAAEPLNKLSGGMLSGYRYKTLCLLAGLACVMISYRLGGGGSTDPSSVEPDLGASRFSFLHLRRGDAVSPVVHYYNLTDTRPPLEEIFHNVTAVLDTNESKSLVATTHTKIRPDANLTFLLDFAIIGHAKTATTTLQHWLVTHPQVLTWEYERHDLAQGSAAQLALALYDELPSGDAYVRGYSEPREIKLPASLQAIGTYWPTTKLIVGVRHPISWFESFYNFRARRFAMPPPNQLQGACPHDAHDVCAFAAAFHVHLSKLGKTAMQNAEQHLLRLDDSDSEPMRWPRHQLANPVFLYEVHQLGDRNVTRASQFATDLAGYLELAEPLGALPSAPSSHTYPKVLDICEPTYDDLRHILLDIGTKASTWIRTYFVPLANVTISSPQYFDTLLDSWTRDPCNDK